MLETFIKEEYRLFSWHITLKVIATPPRTPSKTSAYAGKKYPSHLAITITTYTGWFERWIRRLTDWLR